MKTKLKFLWLFLLISTICISQNGEKNFIDQPYIEVTGTIETEIIPNEIYLNIVLNENDKKGKVSVEKQENQMITVLKTLQLDLEKKFSILDFNGFYKRKIFADNEVSKTKRYELIVSNGETLGKVYQALDRIDISNISIVKTSHSDIKKINRETKLKALKIAKEKASDYASAINQTLGKAIFIGEQNFNNLNGFLRNANVINTREYMAGYNLKSEQDKIQNLNFKTITVSATVLAKFILN